MKNDEGLSEERPLVDGDDGSAEFQPKDRSVALAL